MENSPGVTLSPIKLPLNDSYGQTNVSVTVKNIAVRGQLRRALAGGRHHIAAGAGPDKLAFRRSGYLLGGAISPTSASMFFTCASLVLRHYVSSTRGVWRCHKPLYGQKVCVCQTHDGLEFTPSASMTSLCREVSTFGTPRTLFEEKTHQIVKKSVRFRQTVPR